MSIISDLNLLFDMNNIDEKKHLFRICSNKIFHISEILLEHIHEKCICWLL